MELNEKILLDHLDGINKHFHFVSIINGKDIEWDYGSLDGEGYAPYSPTSGMIRIFKGIYEKDHFVNAFPFDDRRNGTIKWRDEVVKKHLEEKDSV